MHPRRFHSEVHALRALKAEMMAIARRLARATRPIPQTTALALQPARRPHRLRFLRGGHWPRR